MSLGQQRGVTGREFGDAPVLLGLRDHQEMHRCLRRDVAQREEAVGLGDDLTGDLPGQDAREDRGFRHGSSLLAGLRLMGL